MGEPFVRLNFDDEDAGGNTFWTEVVPQGCGLPAAGDWVWNESNRKKYEVVRRSWGFVQPGSPNAARQDYWPLVQIHVQEVDR